jgi:hypothetical protein
LVNDGVVLDFGVAKGESWVRVLGIGDVDINDAIQEPKRGQGVVAAAVVDERKVQSSRHGYAQSLKDLWNHVAGRNQVDVVSSLVLQVEHQIG